DRNSDRGLHGVHSFRVALRARLRPPPRSTLFPYTTLFRSLVNSEHPSLEKLRLLEVLSGDLHEVNAWFGWIFDEHFCVVFAVFLDRKSTRLNSSHRTISYAVFCLKKKIKIFFPIKTASRAV